MQVDDVVDVLQERVDPHQQYHLCRHIRRTSPDSDDTTMQIGWYPIHSLQRYEPSAVKRSVWWRLGL